MRLHAAFDGFQDANAVFIGPIVQNVTQPIDVSATDRVGFEEVMNHELNPITVESRGVLTRPDFIPGLVDGVLPVLEDKLQIGVDLR